MRVGPRSHEMMAMPSFRVPPPPRPPSQETFQSNGNTIIDLTLVVICIVLRGQIFMPPHTVAVSYLFLSVI